MAKNKLVDRTEEIILSVVSQTVDLISEQSIKLEKHIEDSRQDIAARIVPTVAVQKIEELKAELSLVGTPSSPKCQFCGTVLGKVKKRNDGYLCCQACSVKHFSTV